MDKIIAEEKLSGAFPYLDNITIAGIYQEDHDKNDQAFHEMVGHKNINLNVSKTEKS